MPTTYAARFVFPVSRPPLPDAGVQIDSHHIAELVTGRRGRSAARHLGNVAILPGLVNAHTHLEFIHLRQPLGAPGIPLAAWLMEVIRHRRQVPPDELEKNVAQGAWEALQGGTTRLTDTITSWLPLPPMPRRPALTLLQELRGLTRHRVAEAAAKLQSLAERGGPLAPGSTVGVSPHAPYSTHRRIVQDAADQAARHNWTASMHLAESLDERTLLQQQRGPLRDLLEQLGVWRAEAFQPSLSFGDYLRWLSKAPRSLVIHGNDLRREDWEFLSKWRNKMTLVYCGRTHAYFRHPPYPLAALLRQRVRVALGTDSRASNPDLSMWEEWRAVALRHADVAPGRVLDMATRQAACAVGFGRREGCLEAGRIANLVAVQLPHRTAGDPFDLLLDPSAHVMGVMFRGRWIVRPPDLPENRQGE